MTSLLEADNVMQEIMTPNAYAFGTSCVVTPGCTKTYDSIASIIEEGVCHIPFFPLWTFNANTANVSVLEAWNACPTHFVKTFFGRTTQVQESYFKQDSPSGIDSRFVVDVAIHCAVRLCIEFSQTQNPFFKRVSLAL